MHLCVEIDLYVNRITKIASFVTRFCEGHQSNKALVTNCYRIYSMSSKYCKDKIRSEYELQIVPKEQKALSKKQQAFNRLTQRIKSLKQDIREDSAKLDILMELYGNEVAPQYPRIAESRIKLAKVLARATERISFSSRHYNAIGEAIVSLCEEAFGDIDINAELEEFYDRWAEDSCRAKFNQQLHRAKEMFADMMRDRYDVYIDVEDIEDSTEGFAQFKQRMKVQIEQERQHLWQECHQRSKRQRQKAMAKKAEEELKQRSIRTIYISLAKVVHPDGEMDDVARIEKEAILRQPFVLDRDKNIIVYPLTVRQMIDINPLLIGLLEEDDFEQIIKIVNEDDFKNGLVIMQKYLPIMVKIISAIIGKEKAETLVSDEILLLFNAIVHRMGTKSFLSSIILASRMSLNKKEEIIASRQYITGKD